MLLQRALAFSNFVFVADLDAFSVQVEVEGCRCKEPQPLVVLSKYPGLLLLKNRLRLRESLQRASAFSRSVNAALFVAFER